MFDCAISIEPKLIWNTSKQTKYVWIVRWRFDCLKISISNKFHWFRKSKSSHRRCSVRKGALRNFAKITGKHLYQSVFFIKKKALAQVFSCGFCKISCNFIKKEALVFCCEFCKISKNIFFTEYLWTTASDNLRIHATYDVLSKLTTNLSEILIIQC